MPLEPFDTLRIAVVMRIPPYLIDHAYPVPRLIHQKWRRRFLCEVGLHKWDPPRADGYERSLCQRCGLPWRRA